MLLPLAFGCASSTGVNPLEPEIQIEQLPASEFVVEHRGAVSIAYRMVVRNRSAESIKLRKLEMKAVGRSPYALRNEPLPFDETIEPGKEGIVIFEMWAYPREGRSKAAAWVSVSGVAHFENTTGSFRKVFTQSFREPRSAD